MEKNVLFVGGFTDTGENGLSVYEFGSGKLKLVSQTNAGPNPSYFCYSQSKKLLYSINETEKFNGEDGGGITTLQFDAAKRTFEKKSEMVIPNGGPCFISLSPDSGYLFVANYPEGCVAVIRLDEAGIPKEITDTILYETDSINVSHAHMIMNDPSGEKIYVTDLGLDRITIYDFDAASGRLTPQDTLHVPAGSGPRHFVFSADGSELYVINELGSRITVFDINDGKASGPVQILSTYREDFKGENFCADIHLGKDGKFLYGSNRGENTIVAFRVEDNGRLTLQGHTSCGGDWPRNFVIDPSGKFLLAGNQKSGTIAVFSLDSKTGMPEGPVETIENIAPACLKFIK